MLSGVNPSTPWTGLQSTLGQGFQAVCCLSKQGSDYSQSEGTKETEYLQGGEETWRWGQVCSRKERQCFGEVLRLHSRPPRGCVLLHVCSQCCICCPHYPTASSDSAEPGITFSQRSWTCGGNIFVVFNYSCVELGCRSDVVQNVSVIAGRLGWLFILIPPPPTVSLPHPLFCLLSFWGRYLPWPHITL